MDQKQKVVDFKMLLVQEIAQGPQQTLICWIS